MEEWESVIGDEGAESGSESTEGMGEDGDGEGGTSVKESEDIAVCGWVGELAAL